jgi:hypothetical protein
VATVADQQVIALAQRRGQIETRNAAAGPTEVLAITPENDSGAVELLEHARRNNPDDADVPGQLALDDDEVGLCVESRTQVADDFIGDAALDLLPRTVMGVQLLRDGQGFSQVGGQQQTQGVLGGFEAARGIETGRELEAHFIRAEQGRGLSDSFQGDKAGPPSSVEAFQTSGYQDAVFRGERDNVGNGAEGDQVKQGAQVEVGRARETGFTSALYEGVGELEG